MEKWKWLARSELSVPRQESSRFRTGISDGSTSLAWTARSLAGRRKFSR